MSKITVNEFDLLNVKGTIPIIKPAKFTIEDLYNLSPEDIDKCISFLEAFRDKKPSRFLGIGSGNNKDKEQVAINI
jgi:hypothetical protein